MTEDIKNRINDLADCFTGEGVPNLAYIEKGILELNNIVNQAKKYEVLDLVSNPLFTPVKFGEWVLRNVAEGYSDDIGICWLLDEEKLSTKELFEIYKNNPNDC